MAKKKTMEEFGGKSKGTSVLSLAVRPRNRLEVPFYPPQFFRGQA